MGAAVIALLFPGQGSQAAGMGCDLYDAYPVARDIFDEASEVLGYDLTGVCRVGARTSRPTEITQPALLAHSVAACASCARAASVRCGTRPQPR